MTTGGTIMRGGCIICRAKKPRQKPTVVEGRTVDTGWHEITVRDQQTGLAQSYEAICGWACLEKWLRRNMMMDPTEREKDALKEAGQKAGRYLDTILKSDLATLSRSEWEWFLVQVCEGYLSAMGRDTPDVASAENTSPMAGEYLDSINKSDLAELTPEEWDTLLEVIVGAYTAAELQSAGDEVPF
jgi:hypothetical protein